MLSKSKTVPKSASILFIALIFSTIQFTSCAVAQSKHDIVSSDGFKLKSTVWKHAAQSPAIILLHQCDSDQRMYLRLASILYDKGFHVVTFDYRGIGESINSEFNIETAKNQRQAEEKTRRFSTDDLESVMTFVRKNFNKTLGSISLLGASCGGGRMLYLAEKYKSEVRAIGIFSSRLSQTFVKQTIEKLSEKPAIFIAAKGDKRAYEAALMGKASSKSQKSKLIVYEGNDHGYPLFKKDPKLEETIAAWFQNAIQKESK